MSIIKTLFIFIFLLKSNLIKAQEEIVIDKSERTELLKSSIVQQHKDNLHLTLIIDSIIVEKKTLLPNFYISMPIAFESDYIKVNDSLYVKIFISRHQEYGKKFYTWKWDYLQKKDGQFRSFGQSMYETMDYNGTVERKSVQGHGVGEKGKPGYVMYYYRYSLE